MRARTIVAAVVLLLGWGGAARAQRADSAPAPPSNARFGDPSVTAPNYQDYHYGVVKRVSETSMVCDKTEFGDDQPFKIDKRTKFAHDGRPSAAADLKQGDKVWVKIRTDKRTGEMTALRVISGVFNASLTK